MKFIPKFVGDGRVPRLSTEHGWWGTKFEGSNIEAASLKAV